MSRDKPLRILLAASEVVGYAKTGGLADVAGSLPRALARRGHHCAVFLPLYHGARTGKVHVEPTDHTFEVPVAGEPVPGRLWRSKLPGSDVDVFLVENADYFERDNAAFGRGLYTYTATAGGKRDYPDNAARYLFFCRAVLEAVRLLDFWPHVLHCNDWQTGLLPVYLREVYDRLDDPDLRDRYRRIRTLFTIHNIAYQGWFPKETMETASLDWRLFNYLQLECYDQFNFLKSALVYADLLNTVSPTYAREIQTPYYGVGMHTVLYERRDRLSGIVNGIDPDEWNPATDRHLPAHYDADNLEPGKAVCKAAVQKAYGLPEEPETPLLGVVARLVEQKGIDLIVEAAPGFLNDGCQLVVLGDGDPAYHEQLEGIRRRFPGRVGLNFGFDNPLAHRIEAGADLFLMPSLYEPCGLNQFYSMRYGTPPVVRATGGLADTVTDTTAATLADGTATGFRFAAYSGEALLETVRRGVALYRSGLEAWHRVVRNAMRQDWSWDRSAAEYERLYRRLAARPA